LDDAWIHRVYSASFAAGNGFEYNPGQTEAGSTSPLWSIVTAPAHWIEGLGTSALVIGVKLVGVLLAIGLLAPLMRIGNHLTGSKTPGVVAATLLAVDPRVMFSALSGMETLLLVFLWLTATDQLFRGRYLAASILIGLTPTARPEALILLPLFAIALGVQVFLNKEHWKRMWVMIATPVPMFIWGLFCQRANGHWLPTTFYMKSTSIDIGSEQFISGWNLLGMNGPLPSAFVAAGLLLALGLVKNRGWRTVPAMLLLVAAPLAMLFGVLFSREFLAEGYYWIRWTDPAVIILSAMSAMALCSCFSYTQNKRLRIAMGLAALAALPHFTLASSGWRARLISDARAINLLQIQTGKWLAENTPDDAVIGVNDAGAIRYFSGRKTIDLMGLNNADIAFGRHHAENEGIIDYLAITPVWFHDTGITEGMEELTHFAIPAEEYTITSNKGQREIVVFKVQ
jgi:hypothetical protein